MAKREQTSLVARMRQSLRSYWSGPLTSNSPEVARLWASHPVASGVTVNESTALRYSAFFGAVNLISSQLATPPLFLLKRDEDNGKSRFPVSNPLYRLIHDRPNPEMSSFEWRKVMQAHALTWMGGFSEIERNQEGRPINLWPLVPGRVRPFRQTPDSDLQYLVSNAGGGNVVLDRMDVIHIKGLSLDGVNGLSMTDQMSDSLGLGIAAERFGSGFYGNGASFGGVISYPDNPGDLVKKNNRETLAARHQGVQNAHRLLALYGGAKYEQIGIAPNLAQFLETRQFQVTEVARWFNIPPHKLGDLSRSTNNNIEQQDIDFYKTTMLPWFTGWEQELWYKLVPRLEQNLQIIEFFVDGLLRGDVAARGEFYVKQSLAGAITPNEIRSAENRNKIPGGDISLVPLNMIPLHQISDYYQAEIDSKKAATTVALRPPPVPNVVETTPTPNETKAAEELQLARRKAQEYEDAKDLAGTSLTEARTALVAAEYAKAEAEREQIRLTALATSLGTDLATATSDLSATREALQNEKSEHALSVEQFTAMRTSADGRTVEVQARYDALFERVAVLEADGAIVAEARDAATARVVAVEVERDAALGETTAAIVSLDEARARVQTAEQALRERAEGFERDLLKAQQESAQSIERAEAAEQRMAVSGAVVAELRGQIGVLKLDAELRESEALRVRDALAKAEQRCTDLDVTVATLTSASMAQSDEWTETRQRLSATGAAIKGALAYSVDCIIRREADRARKAQASPEKLLRHLENFYPTHGEYCREALRPMVRAVAALDGSDANLLLDRIVPSLIEESTVQLRLVASDTDPETLAPALERVLRRWEAERADAVADRLMREGLNYGR